MIGTVIWFDNFKKGFGWIKSDNIQKDIWCHRRNIVNKGFKLLLPKDKIKFDLKKKGSRIEAINIERIDG